MWASWFDDLIACGQKKTIFEELKKMNNEFKCDDGGSLQEYVGCKIDYSPQEHRMKLTQPVLIQSFEDEFGVKKLGRVVPTPAAPNTILKREEPEGTEADKT